MGLFCSSDTQQIKVAPTPSRVLEEIQKGLSGNASYFTRMATNDEYTGQVKGDEAVVRYAMILHNALEPELVLKNCPRREWNQSTQTREFRGRNKEQVRETCNANNAKRVEQYQGASSATG